jgi:ABC-2 type transport system permease protein
VKKYIANFEKYRFLLGELVKKDIKLKYRRSKLGIMWTLIEPILMAIVLTIVFSNLRGNKMHGFPVYLLAGRTLFQFFNTGTKAAARSIRSNSGMMRKVYIPKYMYPLGSVLSNFVTFLISMIVLVGACVIFKIQVTKYILLAPIPLFILMVMTFGMSMILATLEVFFRDVEYLWTVTTTLIMYCTAIFYVPEKMHSELLLVILKWNPVYGVIRNFRESIFYGKMLDAWSLGYSGTVAVLLTLIGVYLFYKKQDEFILYL